MKKVLNILSLIIAVVIIGSFFDSPEVRAKETCDYTTGACLGILDNKSKPACDPFMGSKINCTDYNACNAGIVVNE